jgi:hypothetical protein
MMFSLPFSLLLSGIKVTHSFITFQKAVSLGYREAPNVQRLGVLEP